MTRVPWWPATTVATAATITILVCVPAWHFSYWEIVALVAGALASFVLAAPIHRAAWQRSTVHVTSSLGIIAGWAWAAYHVKVGTGQAALVLAVLPAALAVVGHSSLQRSNTVIPRKLAQSHLALVVAIAGAGAAVAGAVGGADRAFQTAVATLVAAAPSALMTARATAMFVGRRAGERIGARASHRHALSAASRADTIVLVKDGTVTTGDLTVISVDPVEPDHDRNLRWFAGALEHACTDRVGKAVAQLAGRGRLSNVQHHDGCGISGSVDRHPVRVGAPDWLGVQAPDTIWTTVAVEVDARPLGTITVADQLRAHAAEDVARLGALGLGIVLVAAAEEARAIHIAKASGIHDVRIAAASEVCDELGAQGHRVILAGEHAPPVGVTSFGPDGSDVVLDDCSVGRVASAIGWARSSTTRSIRASRTAFGCAALGCLLAASGLLTPVLAAVFATVVTAAAALFAAGRGAPVT